MKFKRGTYFKPYFMKNNGYINLLLSLGVGTVIIIIFI